MRLPGLLASADAILVASRARVPSLAPATIVAIGWATVDAERAIVELGGARWTTGPRDELLGARARLRAAKPADREVAVGLVVLEPDSEGRLAASLARFGEGVAAVYVRGRGEPSGDRPGDRIGPLGPGPFGPARLVRGGPAWGPHVIVVGSPALAVDDVVE